MNYFISYISSNKTKWKQILNNLKKINFLKADEAAFLAERSAIKEITSQIEITITIKNTIPKIIIIINKVQEFINTINMFHI